jgi:hypothetical protein
VDHYELTAARRRQLERQEADWTAYVNAVFKILHTT